MQHPAQKNGIRIFEYTAVFMALSFCFMLLRCALMGFHGAVFRGASMLYVRGACMHSVMGLFMVCFGPFMEETPGVRMRMRFLHGVFVGFS